MAPSPIHYIILNRPYPPNPTQTNQNHWTQYMGTDLLDPTRWIRPVGFNLLDPTRRTRPGGPRKRRRCRKSRKCFFEVEKVGKVEKEGKVGKVEKKANYSRKFKKFKTSKKFKKSKLILKYQNVQNIIKHPKTSQNVTKCSKLS